MWLNSPSGTHTKRSSSHTSSLTLTGPPSTCQNFDIPLLRLHSQLNHSYPSSSLFNLYPNPLNFSQIFTLGSPFYALDRTATLPPVTTCLTFTARFLSNHLSHALSTPRCRLFPAFLELMQGPLYSCLTIRTHPVLHFNFSPSRPHDYSLIFPKHPVRPHSRFL